MTELRLRLSLSEYMDSVLVMALKCVISRALWMPPMYDILHIWVINAAVQTQHSVVVHLYWIYIASILIGYIKLYNEVYWTRRLIVLILLIVLIDSILNPENLVH